MVRLGGNLSSHVIILSGRGRGAMPAFSGTLLTRAFVSDRLYDVQEEAIKMRRNETILCAMPEEECRVRGIQEGL